MLIFFLFPWEAQSQDLRIGIHGGLREPLIIRSEERITGGILFDLTRELSGRTGLTYEFVTMPRLRLDMAMAEDTINIRNYSNPAWTPERDSFTWSAPLFQARDMVMTKSTHRPLKALSDMSGMKLGTLLGYIYPLLDPLFASGKVQRSDVTDMNQNYGKLDLDRIDGMVADELLLRWYSRGTPESYKIHDLVLSGFEIKWALNKTVSGAHPEILPALEAMVKDGTVDRILSRYR